MKKALFVGIFLVIGFRLISILVAHPALPSEKQAVLSENEKLASFCKVWGFLKYYHPKVASGKIDWDKSLIEQLPKVISANNEAELSLVYLNWINELGKIKSHKTEDFPDSLKFNLNLEWLHDKNLFSDELIAKLEYIRANRNEKENYYVKQNPSVGNTNYENEKAYPDSLFPRAGCRLLSLFRYWNIINYYFPYKHLITENWDSVLVRMIPKFQNAKDLTEYHLAIQELVASVDDSHAAIATPGLHKYFGVKVIPFSIRIIDNKAVVTRIRNDSLAAIDDIQIGDVIETISGIPVADLLRERSKYFAASNEPTRLRILSSCLFNGKTDLVNIQFERNNVVQTKIIHRYYWSAVNRKGSKDSIEPAHWKIMANNIGYVNMGLLTKDEVDKAMSELMNTSAIIFDTRNYPRGTMYRIAQYLNNEKKEFVKFTAPEMSYPGVLRYTKTLSCGGTNPDYYKGKVVLLINEETQSHAEFTCMALQTAPNAKIIGSQTAGADGNVSPITFPGNLKTYMTGIGVYYPDGRETQRIGIVPDIVVNPTIAGIKQNKDEVLDRALLYISSGK